MEIVAPKAVRDLVADAEINFDLLGELRRIEAMPQGEKVVTKTGLKFIRTNRINDGFCNRDTGELCTARDILYKHGGLREAAQEELVTDHALPAIAKGANYDQRVNYVLELCYHQLSTDQDLEMVTAPAAYVTLTNMLAAVLDEQGSPQISLARRFAYRLEAALKDWSGVVTP